MSTTWKRAALAVALTLVTTAAHARLIVRSSTTDSYRPRQVLAPNEIIKIPAGKEVVVLLPDGTTRLLTSAQNGPTSAVLKTSKPEASWWKDLIKYLQSGGAVASTGGTRGGPSISEASKPQTTFTIESVKPDAATGAMRVCVTQGILPTIARDRSEGAHAVSIAADGSDRPAALAFKSGETRLAWPSSIPIVAGMSYRVVPSNHATIVVEMKTLAKGLAGDARLQALGAAGCFEQMGGAD